MLPFPMSLTLILRLPSPPPILSALRDRFLALFPTCKSSSLQAFPPVFLLTPLDSALTDSCARKSFRIRSYEKTWGHPPNQANEKQSRANMHRKADNSSIINIISRCQHHTGDGCCRIPRHAGSLGPLIPSGTRNATARPPARAQSLTQRSTRSSATSIRRRIPRWTPESRIASSETLHSRC